MNKDKIFNKLKNFIGSGFKSITLSVIVSVLFVTTLVTAATIISENIETAGTLTVTGASTMATTTFSGDVDFSFKQLTSFLLEKLTIFPTSPVAGQTFFSTASSTAYTYTGSQWKGDVSGATFVVAASDSLNKEKADYICDGTADDVQIQAAFDALPSGGGKVQLMEGTFTISATITTSASSTLQGVGWGTILDVSGISSTNNAITMSDNTVLSDLKVQGTISPLTMNWHEVEAGNHSNLERIWIDNNTYGIGTTNKSNVHINDCKFTNIKDSSGWAAALHASGTSNGIFIDGVYISDCDRAFEVEDGAKNVFAQHGYIYNVYSDIAGYSFVLDAHSHENGGGVDNVVYRDFYLENSYPISVDRSTGSNESDIPRNITFENIVIVDPTAAMDIDGIKVTFRNCKIATANPTNKGELNITTMSKYVTIENTTMTDFKGYGAISNSGQYTVIKNNHLHAPSSSPGNYGILNSGSNTKIINNYIYGIPNTRAMSISGINNIVKGNIMEISSIWMRTGSSYNIVKDNVMTAGTNIVNDGANNIFENNIGYTTATSSTATITSGNTYVAVTHSLNITPATSTISILPLEDLGNASTTNFWISDVGATTFRINVGTNPGKDVDFAWNTGSY